MGLWKTSCQLVKCEVIGESLSYGGKNCVVLDQQYSRICDSIMVITAHGETKMLDVDVYE